MKIKQTTSMLAMAALLVGAGAAFAGNGNSTYDASVSVLSPDQTGFIIGGQVSVNGLGSGGLTLTRSAAEMSLTGKASSQQSFDDIGALAGVKAGSSIESSLNFDRSITTNGSLVGQGSVAATGQAIASMGSAGAASANTTTAGTTGTTAEGSATAQSSSQGSLNGSLSTSNGLQLLGTSGLFAGSNGLTVGENNKAIAYGSAGITADTATTGVNLGGATASGAGLLHGTGDGALFNVASTLTGGPLALSVSNAGNGTIAVTTSTGGFFTGGGAAGGSSALSQSGSFFSNVWCGNGC